MYNPGTSAALHFTSVGTHRPLTALHSPHRRHDDKHHGENGNIHSQVLGPTSTKYTRLKDI